MLQLETFKAIFSASSSLTGAVDNEGEALILATTWLGGSVGMVNLSCLGSLVIAKKGCRLFKVSSLTKSTLHFHKNI